MKWHKVAPDDLPKEDEFDYNKALTWFLGNFFYEGNSDDDWLFLTYRPLEIEWHELNTQDFNEAKKKAVEYIQHTMQTLCNKVEVDKNKLIQAIVEPDTFSRY